MEALSFLNTRDGARSLEGCPGWSTVTCKNLRGTKGCNRLASLFTWSQSRVGVGRGLPVTPSFQGRGERMDTLAVCLGGSVVLETLKGFESDFQSGHIHMLQV